MTVRVSKIEAAASEFPRPLFLHRDAFGSKPRFPCIQFCGGSSESDVQFAVAGRLDRARSSLLEEQQHLARTRLHGATPFTKVADNAEAEDVFIEANRARYIAHVQRGFDNTIGSGRHKSLLVALPTVA